MHLHALIPSLVVAVSMRALAADKVADTDCGQGSANQMAGCVQEQAAAAERELQSLIEQMKAELQWPDRELIGQSAWKEYRDKECGSWATLQGSEGVMQSYGCLLEHTLRRIEELRSAHFCEQNGCPARIADARGDLLQGEWNAISACPAQGPDAERCHSAPDRFTLSLWVIGKSVCGFHLASANFGNKVDEGDLVDEGKPSIVGTLKGLSAQITYKSAWGGTGSAIIELDEGLSWNDSEKLSWKVVHNEGQTYIPQDALLSRQESVFLNDLQRKKTQCLIAVTGSPVEGTWLTAPDDFHKRDVLTVQQVRGDFEVRLHTVACPTNNDCGNARLADTVFSAALQSDYISTKSSDCEIQVYFQGTQATATVRGCKESFPNGGPRNPFVWQSADVQKVP